MPERQNETVEEQARRVPVRDRHDVIVAGGGLGGVAAALSSARAGANTLLIERNAFVGGVATAGMCCSIFNCYYTGGDDRRLATGGIAVEIADALAEATGYGAKWRAHKGHVIYDVELAKLVLQQLLGDAGVHLLLNAWVADAIVRDGRIVGLITETKSGRQAHASDVVVDATGDADVAARAGATVLTRTGGKHSLCFRLGNVDVDTFVDSFRDHPDQFPEYMDVDWSLDEALAQYGECGTFLFPHGGGMQMRAFQAARASGELPATERSGTGGAGTSWSSPSPRVGRAASAMRARARTNTSGGVPTTSPRSFARSAHVRFRRHTTRKLTTNETV